MNPDLDRWLPPKDVTLRGQWAKAYPARSALGFTIAFFPFVAAFGFLFFVETETLWISVVWCLVGSLTAFLIMLVGNKRLSQTKSRSTAD